MVEQIFGTGSAGRWIYLLDGFAGIELLVSCVYTCPACRKVKAT